MRLVDIELIRDAAELIRPHAVRTPLLASPWPGLWLKPENLQPIGAFKIRGAVTAISRLDPAVRARGVLAHSSGNHAQAVAYTARAFGIDAHIVIPDNAPRPQDRRPPGTSARRSNWCRVEQRFSRPAELAAQTGKAMIPPFDHPDVISGQGTVGLEIAEDLPDVDAVLVPVSGGGLISGIAAAITALLPNAKVIGVEPELAGDAAESFRAGRRIPGRPPRPPERWPTGCARSASASCRGSTSAPRCTTSSPSPRTRSPTPPGGCCCRPGWWPSPAAPSPRPRTCSTATSCRRDAGGRGLRRQHRPGRAAGGAGRCLRSANP